MSIIEQLKKGMTPEAFSEFEKASEGMKLANLATGEYVAKGKYDADIGAIKKENEALKAQSEQSAAKLEELSKSGANVQEITEQMKAMEAKYKEEIQSLQKQHRTTEIAASIKSTLSTAGAYDPELAYKALEIDADKVEFGENNTIIGLTERIKALQDSKPFLWKETKPANGHLPTEPKGPESQSERVNAMLESTGFVKK